MPRDEATRIHYRIKKIFCACVEEAREEEDKKWRIVDRRVVNRFYTMRLAFLDKIASTKFYFV